MNIKLERIIVIIGAIIVIALAIGLPFIFQPSDSLLPSFALSQLAFSAVAFFMVFLALYFTIVQLRKSMAKPKLEVVFSENGKSEYNITIHKDIPEGEEYKHEIELSVINKGNAITKFFQIDFLIPPLYRPRLDASSQLIRGVPNAPLRPKFEISESDSVVSTFNPGVITCFVNKPTKIPSLLIGTFTEKYDQYPKEFIITYGVYGDWAETQEGKLKIIIKKQEVPHATG